jgi:tRNA A-37 threonylcarbamoyl transferase component Bud32/tetratricopeptide (TPR) repeat protein
MRQSDLSSSVAAAPEAALTRGTALGRFVVLGLVGRGAMGEVYGAYDPDLDRKIAIKLVRARADRGGDTVDGRTRLMREAQATAKISHPNVVIVYDAGTFGDRVFIAMEFIEGHTLRYWLQEKERPWREILDAFLAAGRGLAAAHDKELVHRDFKPDNVMVATGGQVRVMDFGLARIADGGAGSEPATSDARLRLPSDAEDGRFDLEATPILGGPPVDDSIATGTMTLAFRDKITATGALLGTPAYMSPEQFQGRPADARSDQFSFCVALFEAIHGERPFSGRTLAELANNVVEGRLAESPGGGRVSGWLRKVLERGLRADPEERFPSMNALLTELEKRQVAGPLGFARGAAAKLAGVWEAPVAGHPVETPQKEAIRRAFLATDKVYAAAAFAGVSAALDRYAHRWSELYVEVCEATHVRGEQSAEVLDLRMACLQEGLDDLKALCRLFRAATADVVGKAVSAANALGMLERVQDVKLLRALVRPPDDAVTRDAVDDLRLRLVELRALVRVGKYVDGLKVVAPLVEDARRVGYSPILAEALFVQGTLQIESAEVRIDAFTLEDAVWTAELARHDEVAAAAASHLVFLMGYQQERFEVGEIWSRHAHAVLRRMGPGHDQLWGWYFNNRATMRERQGRLAEAISDDRLAIEAKERAFGPDSPDLAITVGNLANHLCFRGDFQEAYEVSTRALAMLTASLGPDHPATAILEGNHGQFLCRLARFEEALQSASRALVVMERETDPRGLLVTFPLRTIGLSLLGLGRCAEGVVVLERAVALREAVEKTPLRLAEVHFALARALDGAGAQRERSIALARRARSEYAQGTATPVVELDRAELERWLAAREG